MNCTYYFTVINTMIWKRLFLLKSTTEIHYLHITISMIKSVFFLTILIHISAGQLLISSFKHLKDERNIVNSTVPSYLHFLKLSCLLLLSASAEHLPRPWLFQISQKPHPIIVYKQLSLRKCRYDGTVELTMFLSSFKCLKDEISS